ncbi:MAG TPA: N-acetyl-gamma-glutamyl-phosphate reductase [Acidimicrobiales bacterium]|jgi:N-acetyl-gamma-glutamyl-phosphate reductase|nr:N-acetyl-gamma-glutamyl-phosphate reductase [Acidimicrobiales bacterium]
MKCGVAGASGYLGAELLRLLADHPKFDVVTAQADSTAGARLGDEYPALARAYPDLVLDHLDVGALADLDTVFVALPSGQSQDVVASLAGRVGLVVDLGADFRLKDPAAYPQWYGFEHTQPALLAEAVYGLPELYRESLAGARLISSPGCYVTAASLALEPLVGAGLVETSGIVVDAASGTSGAGKVPGANFHHPLANERFAPYGLLTHRHTPEIEQVIGAQVIFTPHLAPMTRGILTTCYARPTAGTNPSTGSLLDFLAARYAGDPFVHVTAGLPSTADAYGSNVAHLTARYDERTGWVLVLAAIDNLVKGGSGQAVQAANVALRIPETTGLPLVGLSP